MQAAAEGRRAAEEEAEGLRVALASARTAADASRAKLTAEQIGAQQRLAAFEKLKQDLEVLPAPVDAPRSRVWWPVVKNRSTT